MNKYLLSFIFVLILSIFINHRLTYADFLGEKIIGLDCGMAEDTTGKNICCENSPAKLDRELPAEGGVFGEVSRFVKKQFNNIVGKPMEELNTIQSKVAQPCLKGNPVVDPGTNKCICAVITPAPGALTELTKFCSNLASPREKADCSNCVNGNNIDKSVGVWTSLGCVYTSNMKMFIEKTVLGLGIGLAGLVALLCIIYASFQMQTSRGNPESIKKAQELLTSCVMGLLLIILSVFILRLIGVDILRIPGFGR